MCVSLVPPEMAHYQCMRMAPSIVCCAHYALVIVFTFRMRSAYFANKLRCVCLYNLTPHNKCDGAAYAVILLGDVLLLLFTQIILQLLFGMTKQLCVCVRALNHDDTRRRSEKEDDADTAEKMMMLWLWSTASNTHISATQNVICGAQIKLT